MTSPSAKAFRDLHKFPERPQEWYGFEDYDGFDSIEESMADRDRIIAIWDHAYASLTWWQRFKFDFYPGGLWVPFEVRLNGVPSLTGIYFNGKRVWP